MDHVASNLKEHIFIFRVDPEDEDNSILPKEYQHSPLLNSIYPKTGPAHSSLNLPHAFQFSSVMCN
jgi:hypothetical protein